MTKRLNTDVIVNDLEGSVFFATKRQSPIPLPEKTILQGIQSNQPISERANARTNVRPNGKRIITRNSFEIYEDQMDLLRKLSIQEKMDGKLGSMSAMVRNAIDSYLQGNSTPK
jgi:hypothetical protein